MQEATYDKHGPPHALAVTKLRLILPPTFMRLTPLLFASLCLVGGCVERTLTVQSQPSGALVYLNDQEVGRTPFRKRFIWYGTYDVQVRAEGYQTLKTTTPVIAPWWQWLPFDFFAEVAPANFHDDHAVSYTLVPASNEQINPHAIVDRAEDLSNKLESSRIPATQPTTQPAKIK